MQTNTESIIQRLKVAAGLEADGVSREELDEVADDITKSLAKHHGSYTKALESMQEKAEGEE